MPAPKPVLIVLTDVHGESIDWATITDTCTNEAILEWAVGSIATCEISPDDLAEEGKPHGAWRLVFAWSTDHAVDKVTQWRGDDFPFHQQLDDHPEDQHLALRAETLSTMLQPLLRAAYEKQQQEQPAGV